MCFPESLLELRKQNFKQNRTLQNFKVYKNTIHKLTRINKLDYYKRYFEGHKKNSRKPGMGLDLLLALRKTLTNKSNS